MLKNLLFVIFITGTSDGDIFAPISSLQNLKKSVKLLRPLKIMDFDSACIAEHLTMVDKELFLKIPEIELETIMFQHHSKNTPNVSALIAFSHRVSCLVATEVLREYSIPVSYLNVLIHFTQNKQNNFIYQIRSF